MKPTRPKKQKAKEVAQYNGDVKPYCLKDLCNIYYVTDKTMKKWLEPFENDLADRRGRYYSARHVQFIMSKLGMPYRMRENEDGSFFDV